MSNTQQRDNNAYRTAVNNEQKDPNYITVKSNSEETDESNTIFTRYERIVKRPDRLIYY